MTEITKINSNSVISLTGGILSIIIPIIGLVLGIIGIVTSRKAVKEIEKTSEVGRGLATAGLICSSVVIIIQLFGVLGIIAYYSVFTSNVVTLVN